MTILYAPLKCWTIIFLFNSKFMQVGIENYFSMRFETYEYNYI